MKKHLLLIATAFCVFSAKAQTMYVAPNTDVKIQSGALLYVSGGAKVDTYTDASKKVSNEGQVKITGGLQTSNDDGSSFVEEHIGAGKYGQLIVLNGIANTGKISAKVKTPDNSRFVYFPLALPYSGVTATDVVKQLFGDNAVSSAFVNYVGGRGGFDKNRYKNALFVWNNEKYQLDHLTADYPIGQAGKQADYYAVNAKYAVAGELASAPKTLVGVPVNNDVTVTLNKYSLKTKKNNDVNQWGEAYGSYISDFTMAQPNEWTNYHVLADQGKVNNTDFGARIYYLGNPFTSNINLSKLGADFLNNVQAIVQLEQEGYTEEVNKGNASTAKDADSNVTTYQAITADGTGDVNRLAVVAPFQTFQVKMKESMPETTQVTFNDNVKTFEGPTQGDLVNVMFGKQTNRSINQLGLDLYTAKNQNTGARTYVVASNIYEAAAKGKGTEIYNIAMSDKSMGIYTLQENEDGSVAFEDKTYINGVNADKYIAKPIHLVTQNLQGKYTLKARLNDALAANNNTFFFEDKKTGKVVKVTQNFAYTFTGNGTEKDRFVLYWAKTPEKALEQNLAKEQLSATQVYKEGNSFKVRFEKGINKADVFVYNISGQLISVAKGVSTSTDYVVAVKGNAGVYIVKVVGDNGKVTTKKIIK